MSTRTLKIAACLHLKSGKKRGSKFRDGNKIKNMKIVFLQKASFMIIVLQFSPSYLNIPVNMFYASQG